MPTYVYECSLCKQVFEADQRIVEPPLTTCLCGSEGTVKRVIQPIAVMFKGSGFHINDYASKGAPVEKKAEATETAKPADPAPAAPSTPAADTTPAAPATPSTP